MKNEVKSAKENGEKLNDVFTEKDIEQIFGGSSVQFANVADTSASDTIKSQQEQQTMASDNAG